MSKPRLGSRFHPPAMIAAALAGLALTLTACGPAPTSAVSPPARGPEVRAPEPRAEMVARDDIAAVGAILTGTERCDRGPADAAARNREGLRALAFAPFRRAETGWEIYAPLAAHEIGTACGGDAPAFARRLADWQRAHGLAASGVLDEPTFTALKALWQTRRAVRARQ